MEGRPVAIVIWRLAVILSSGLFEAAPAKALSGSFDASAQSIAASSSPLDSALVGYWSFDQGTAADLSGHGHDGILHGCTSVPGAVCLAESLNGTSDYLDLGNPSDLNPTQGITVAAWYRPVSFSGTGADPIVTKGYTSHSSPYYQYHLSAAGDLRTGGSQFGFEVAIAGQPHSVGTQHDFWKPGVWYFLVGTYNGSKLVLYVNGLLIDSAPLTGPIDVFPTNVLAGTFNNIPSYLPGTIDEIRIYSRAITPSEVGFLYELHQWPSPACENATAVGTEPGQRDLLRVPGLVLGSTTLDFWLHRSGHADIVLLDVRGRRVSSIFDGWTEAGWHAVTWDPRGTPSGAYFIRLTASAHEVLTKRLARIK